MQKIKVAFLISSLGTGGAERQLVHTINCLDSSKYDIALFVLQRKGSLQNQLKVPVHLTFLGVKSYYNPFAVQKVIAAIHEFQPDLLHSVMYASNLLARFYKIKNSRCRVLNHVHGMGSWIRQRHLVLDRLLLRYVDILLVVSEQSKQLRLSRERYPVSKVALVYNCIPVSDYIVAPLRSTPSKIVLGTASRLVPLKQIETGIYLVQSLLAHGREVVFHIAGEGPELGYLQQLVIDLALTDRVVFLGHQEDMPAFYKSIDCFVLFSRTEDMPLSIVEAFASGLPVIAPAIGGIPELLSETISYCYDITAPRPALFEAMAHFIFEVDWAAAHTVNAQKAVAFFDTSRHQQHIASIYQQLYDSRTS